MTTPSPRRPRVLLTSGGTKIPIDDVRHIGNMSSGTFGAAIGMQGLAACDWDLTFLCAQGSRTPMKREFDLTEMTPGQARPALEAFLRHYAYIERYNEVRYQTFDAYAARLDEQLALQPNIVLLAAAVSDYGVAPVSGKIRTHDSLTIQLSPLPKLISTVRAKCPKAVIVGFKLLVNATDEELIEAAHRSVLTNGCDFVVANDLRDIKGGVHRLLLVSNDSKQRPEVRQVKTDLAATVADAATDCWRRNVLPYQP